MNLLCVLSILFGTATAGQVHVGEDGHAYNPHWSPDGGYLAFELNRYGDAVDLFVTKVTNGGGAVPVKVVIPGTTSSFSGRGSVVAHPVWHPEGTLIFEGSNAGGTQRLYFWAPGGQSAAELLSSTQIGGDLTWPSLSPDGRTLAFVSDSAGSGDLFLWSQTSNKVSSTFTSPYAEAAPRFASDGVTLAFTRKNRGTEDLFLFEGGEVKPLKGGNGDQTRPVFADNLVVYFTNERGEGHWDIAVTDTAGAQRTILAREVRLPMRAGPAISPDGRSVVYTMSDPELGDRLMATALDGSRTVEIPTGLVACGEPDLVSSGGKMWAAFTALPSATDDPNAATDWRQLYIVDVTGKLP
jgi:Tol biopolymer transport system component